MPEEREERLAELLGRWREKRDRGGEEHAVDLGRRHPELKGALDAMEALEQRFGGPQPATVGEYRIVRELGRGGMGVVYEAEQTSMRRKVALKVLFPSITATPKPVKRFQQEAWAAGRLKHTNIVAVHQLGHDRGIWYCAMELVEGRPLSDVIADLRRTVRQPRESRLARAALGRDPASGATTGRTTGDRAYFLRVAEMFAGVAEALQVAHDHGVVHRDVKPANLLLDAEGNLKLVDFGLARLEAAGASMTATGEIVGTPLYMSPEQMGLGQGKVDARTDLYSLGATLYETLALRPPFRGKSLQHITTSILRRDPSPPRRWNRRIPRDLETIALKALEKDPAKRYRSAGEMAGDLRRFAEGGAIRARRVGPLERAWRKVRRHPVRAALAAGLLVALAVATYFWVGAREDRARLVEEERWRRNLQYAALCVRAEQAAVAGRHAREIYDRAIALLPDRYEAYLSRSIVSVKLVDLTDLAAAEQRGAPPRVVHLVRAWILESNGRTAEAEAERQSANRHPTDDPLALVFEGVLAGVRGGDRDEKLSLYDKAVARAPVGSTAAFLARWYRCLAREQNLDDMKALEDLHALRAMGDQGLVVRIRIAGLWRRLGRVDEAQALFDEARSEAHTAQEIRDLCQACDISDQSAWQLIAARDGMAADPEDVWFLTEAALACRELELFDDALRYCEEAIALDPDLHDNHCIRGAALLGLERWEQAIDAIRTEFGSDGSCKHGFNNIATALRQLGQHEEALDECRRALSLDPRFALGYENLSFILRKTSDAKGALEAAERSLRYEPRGAGAHNARALALRDLERFEEALEAIDLAIRLEPTTAGLHHNRGLILYGLGEFEKARDAYVEALRLDPDHVDARGNLAALLWKHLEQPEQAEREFDRILARHPDHAVVLVNKGGLLIDTGRAAEAVPILEYTVQLLPREPLAHWNLYEAFRRLEDWQSACDVLETYTDLARDDPEGWGEKGLALLMVSNLAEARASFKRAIELGIKTPGVFQNAAIVEVQTGQEDEALSILERAARDGVESAELCNLHGAVLALVGREADALEAYAQAILRFPADPLLKNGRAWILATARNEELRDPAQAVRLAREAVALAKGNESLRNTLGVALCRAGEWKEALRFLERGPDAYSWFFVAMAKWHVADKAAAREWYAKAAAWTKEHKPDDEELERFRAEAAALLGVTSGG